MIDFASDGPGRAGVRPSGWRCGFSLVDLLVAIGVMGILVALLIPALGSARDAALRVACASNVKQLGIGVSSFAFDNDQRLPVSEVGLGIGNAVGRDGGGEGPRPQDSVVLRFDGVSAVSGERGEVARWDGLGVLFEASRVPAPPVFYCPAYTGEHPLERYKGLFSEPLGEIQGNYQYRAEASGVRLSRIPAHVSLISGVVRSKEEYSHQTGHNYFSADLSVDWFDDSTGELLSSLPGRGDSEQEAAEAVVHAWRTMDLDRRGGGSAKDHSPWSPHDSSH